MTIALLFMLNNRTTAVPSFPEILRMFLENDNYSIYIHLTDSDKKITNFIEPLNVSDNLLKKLNFIPTMKTEYGTFSLTQVMISLLHTAMKSKTNQHFIFLSETDIPLFNPEVIDEFITKNWVGKSWFNREPSNKFYPNNETLKDLYKIGWFKHNSTRHIFSHRRNPINQGNFLVEGKLFLKNIREEGDEVFNDIKSNESLFNELASLISKHDQLGKYLSLYTNSEIKESPPEQLDYQLPRKYFRNGRQQFMICRRHAAIVLQEGQKYVSLFKRQLFASDETFFLSVLAASISDEDFSNTVVWTSGISYSKFGGSSSAHVLNIIDNTEFFLHLKALFIRKVLFSQENNEVITTRFLSRSYQDLLSVFSEPQQKSCVIL